jgi:hypothetical protein
MIDDTIMRARRERETDEEEEEEEEEVASMIYNTVLYII